MCWHPKSADPGAYFGVVSATCLSGGMFGFGLNDGRRPSAALAGGSSAFRPPFGSSSFTVSMCARLLDDVVASVSIALSALESVAAAESSLASFDRCSLSFSGSDCFSYGAGCSHGMDITASCKGAGAVGVTCGLTFSLSAAAASSASASSMTSSEESGFFNGPVTFAYVGVH